MLLPPSTPPSLTNLRPKLNFLASILCPALALLGSANRAEAQCSGTGTVTYNSTGGVSVAARTVSTSTNSISVSLPSSSAITCVSVILKGVTTDGQTYASMNYASFLLTGPNGSNGVEFLGATGDGTDGDNLNDSGSGLSNVNITVWDGASVDAPYFPSIWPHTCSGSGCPVVKPSSYSNAANNHNGNPALGTSSEWAQTDGTATFTSEFVTSGISPNGNWTLSLRDDSPGGPGDPVSITGWSLVMTTVVTANDATSTSLVSATNPSYSGGTSSSVILTATVSDTTNSGTSPVGTVNFTSGGSTISGCGAVTLASGVAHCTTTFATEGIHLLEAAYTPGSGFSASSSAALNQFAKNHSSLSGGKYCNTGAISSDGSTTTPYPSVINVGTDTTALTGSVADVSVTLTGVSATHGMPLDYAYLLVAPDTTKSYNLDFLDDAGISSSQPSVNITVADNNASAPFNGALSSATYEATDQDSSASSFPASTSPAPQVPGTINYAQPDFFDGTALTLGQAFDGANGNGNWSLFMSNSAGTALAVTGGWCLSFTQNTGATSSTTLSSSENPAFVGDAASLTATVTSSGSPVTSGSVTFTENGVAPSGVSNNVVNMNSSGHASISVAGLAEGDHDITATYSGVSNVYYPSSNTLWQREDTRSTASGAGSSTSPALYCNSGGIVLPGSASAIGAASPNPSNIFVSNLPGTLKSIEVELKGFYTGADPTIVDTASLLVGPNNQALDFFSGAGASETMLSLGNYDFYDSANRGVPQSAFSAGDYLPTSYDSTDTFFANASGQYTLPSMIDYAAPHSTPYTFNTENGEGNGVFTSIDANGVWSLYFNQSIHDTGAGATGWCLSLIENLPSVAAVASHTGTFAASQQSAPLMVDIANNGPGSTGDPSSGSHPITVTDTLNSAFTYASVSGTGWSCLASGQTVTCANDGSVSDGSSYPTLTIDVNVSATVGSPISNSVSVTGAIASTVTSTDSITIDSPPAITSANSTAFTVGSFGSFTVTTTGTPTSNLSKAGTLPSGINFQDNGNGTATLAGTPAAGTGGAHLITITAQNGTSPSATQSFALAVDEAPAISSGNSAAFNGGSPGSFIITASGYPVPVLSETGALPSGVTFTDNDNGTATLAGTAAGVVGSTLHYSLALHAGNSISPAAQQAFALAVNSVTSGITAPTPGTTLAGPNAAFVWNAGTGVSAYELWLGTSGIASKNLYDSGNVTSTSLMLDFLPTNGTTIYARLLTEINGVWHGADYTYRAASTAALVTPTPGSTLTGPGVTFSWAPVTGATAYELWLGTTGIGSRNLYNSGLEPATSITLGFLPTNGATVYVRLFTSYNGTFGWTDVTYAALTSPALSTPTTGSNLAGPNVAFSWPPVAGAMAYKLWLGTSGAGSSNLYSSGFVTNTTAMVGGLPTNGSAVYARLFTNYNGTLGWTDVTYTAAASAVLASPAPASMLPGPNVTFSWAPIAGATAYKLWLGSAGAGSSNLYSSGFVSTSSITLGFLPTDGSTVFARLFTNYNGTIGWTDATFTAITHALITAPSPNTRLARSTETFTWLPVSDATGYELLLGTTGAGSSNLFNSLNRNATSATVSGLPTNGQTIYARLVTSFSGTISFADFVYTTQ